MPLMNPLGFETMSRQIAISEEDLNRSFPGDKEGSIAERMADIIFSTIVKTKPALVLDLHNDWIKSIPDILIDPKLITKYREVYDKSRIFAQKTGFLVINEGEDPKDLEELKKTLSGSLICHDIPAITLELGEAYLVNEKNVEDGVKAIWKILNYLKMTKLVNGRI